MCYQLVSNAMANCKAKTPLARLVLQTMAHCSAHGEYWEPTSRLADRCGASRAGTQKALAKLLDAGDIIVVQAGGGRHTTRYRLISALTGNERPPVDCPAYRAFDDTEGAAEGCLRGSQQEPAEEAAGLHQSEPLGPTKEAAGLHQSRQHPPTQLAAPAYSVGTNKERTREDKNHPSDAVPSSPSAPTGKATPSPAELQLEDTPKPTEAPPAPSASAQPPSPGQAVWSEARRILPALGVPSGRVGALVGRWLRELKPKGAPEDVLVEILWSAEGERPGEAVSWVQAAVKARLKPKPQFDPTPDWAPTPDWLERNAENERRERERAQAAAAAQEREEVFADVEHWAKADVGEYLRGRAECAA